MFETHALGNLVSGLLVDQLTQQFVSEGECSGRSLTSGDVTVDGEEVASLGGIVFCQHTFETRIAGGTLALKNT